MKFGKPEILTVVLHSGAQRDAWMSIKNQTLRKKIRVVHEPEMDLSYLRLAPLVNVNTMALNREELMNTLIVLACMHGHDQRKGERYFSVWFDDVEMLDAYFYERAVKLIEADDKLLVGLPPLTPQDQGKTSEYQDCCWRLWVCDWHRWDAVDVKTLLEAGFPQLYVVQQRLLFGDSMFHLDSEWVHKH